MSKSVQKQRGDIAIVGMSCLFANSDGPHQYWQNICAGTENIRPAPENWGAERYLSDQSSAHIGTARGGFLGDLYRFNPAKLGVMPSGVDGGEPDQYLALKATIEALDDSGYLRDGYDHTQSGIIMGHSTYLHRGQASVVQHGVVLDQTIDVVRQLMPDASETALDELRKIMLSKLPGLNSDVSPGLVPNVMTGRIANKLDFCGPNYLIDASCASSLLAVQAAMNELRSGRADLMIAGGVNASVSAEVYSIFNFLGALSQSGQVRPFDELGDGTLLGEGLGVVVLKRLEDAEADGDRIYAVVKGVGHSSDGRSSGLLAPRLEGEVLSIRRAFEDAELEPEGVGLIEAHGTAIPLGDRTEIQALREVFADRKDDLPTMAIGSVKSMIGHCIPAAGIAGLIKTAMALFHRTLPPTVCGAVRPENGIEETPLYVNTQTSPWIQPQGKPRRAGVNAFGFGGVNTHAVLEEAAGPKGQASASAWPSELLVLDAPDAATLIERAEWLRAAVAARPEVRLAGVAAALAKRAGDGPCRLAVVATSVEDLDGKLDKALSRLKDGRGQFQLRSGVFASDTPVDGKMAFVYPGEGAQYQGMLNDILIAFPKAREWFDFWDSLYVGKRLHAPSTCVFPPSTTVSAEKFDELERALFGLEIGSESVFVASQALGAVTEQLGLIPDAVVGHSSGEHSAMRAAGILGAGGQAEMRDTILDLNKFYRQMEEAGAVGEAGALLTVGAISRDRILELVEPGDVHLALDNCEHQAVLFGKRERMDELVVQLRAEGGLCAFLPFDRPYHTPLFSPVSDMVRGVYDKMDFRKPSLPIYSCATTDQFAGKPGEIRDLAASQWRSRVRFTETIRKMYEDGVRIFVEVGPSSNLTGFVDDILKGKDALALSMDSRRRPCLLQLQQTLGRVWLTGRDVDLNAMFSERDVEPVDLDGDPQPIRMQVIDNTLPYIRLSEEEVAPIRAALLPDAPVAAVVPAAEPQPMEEAVGEDDVAYEGDIDPALEGHFALMQDFLDVQQGVLSNFLGASAEQAPAPLHFIHRVIEADEAHLVAECDVDIAQDGYLADHVLYTPDTSDLWPGTGGLPVVPLAVSLEMLAEGAVALVPGMVPLRLEDVRTFDWVIVESGIDLLTISSERAGGDEAEPRVLVRLTRDGAPLVEATVVLGAAPETVDFALAPLAEPREPVWQDHELYTMGMFHGPLYHSIATLTAWDDTGIDTVLNPTPLDWFSDRADPAGLVLNPVLLDAIGHATAYWIAQGHGTDFSSFPSSIDRIDLCDARTEDTGGCALQARVSFEGTGEQGPKFLRGDFLCTAPDGHVIFAARGWRDRFFTVPNTFYKARYWPRDSWYGEDVSALLSDMPDSALVWSVPAFPQGFLTDSGGIWRRVLACTVLAAEEHEQFRALPQQPRRLADWLVGRIAIKEAARSWISTNYGVLLMPADLIVRTTDAGKPYLVGDWFPDLGPMPEISVAHANGEAVAAASAPGQAVGVDFELYGRIKTPDLLDGGFGPDEQALIQSGEATESRALLAWCAKEAAAKMLGEGLNGRPRQFVLNDMGDGDRSARVDTPARAGIRVTMADRGSSVVAVAFD